MLYTELQRLGVTVDDFSPHLRGVGHPDVVHVHWPESALNKPRAGRAVGRSVELLAALERAHARGAKLVWTTHNVAAHLRRHPRAERVFWSAFDRLVDGWIALSDATVGQVVAAHPRLAKVPHCVIPHGHYRDAYPDHVSRVEARRELGLEVAEQVLAFIGRVKSYKGVEHLLETFAALSGANLRLVVAGRCDDPALADSITAAAGRDSRVVLALEAIPDAMLSSWVRAADVVVLPYRAVLNSGSALLALSFDTPVLVPRTGGLRDLAAALPNWVLTYDEELRPADLSDALERLPVGSPDLTAFDWAPIAAQTLAFYERLRAS